MRAIEFSCARTSALTLDWVELAEELLSLWWVYCCWEGFSMGDGFVLFFEAGILI